MNKILNSIYNIRNLDDLSKNDSYIHGIHPIAKTITAVVYLAVVMSYGKYEIAGLLPFLFYPVFIFTFAELPAAPVLKRILIAEPFIIGIGILNPLIDKQNFVLSGLTFSMGWITFLSVFIKCGLSVSVCILLIATTGMDMLASALRQLKVPRIVVLQLLLVYRYISVIIEEVSRMQRAYSLRAPGQKGLHRTVWGSFIGLLILKSSDRAQRVYQCMSLRGFTGEYNYQNDAGLRSNDILFMTGWCLFFVVARIYDIPMLIGSIFTEVIK